jgi:hypothetical protein
MKTSCNVQPSYRSMSWSDAEALDHDSYEKISRTRDGYMPVASHAGAIRGAHRTPASRSGGRRVS